MSKWLQGLEGWIGTICLLGIVAAFYYAAADDIIRYFSS